MVLIVVVLFLWFSCGFIVVYGGFEVVSVLAFDLVGPNRRHLGFGASGRASKIKALGGGKRQGMPREGGRSKPLKPTSGTLTVA